MIKRHMCTVLLVLSLLCNHALADTACEVNNGKNQDFRNFPTTPNDTILNSRNDGVADTCVINGEQIRTFDYSSGLTVNITKSPIQLLYMNTYIFGGLTVNGNDSSNGLFIIGSEFGSTIEGNVNIINKGKLELVSFNNSSSTPRFHYDNAIINIENNSALQIDYNTSNITGYYMSLRALTGEGETIMNNFGPKRDFEQGSLYIHTKDNDNYVYNGDFVTSNGKAIESLHIDGPGKWTFTGEIRNAGTGGTIGFTDGFEYIEVNRGSTLEITTKPFIYGSRVDIGGTLIFNQSFDDTVSGAEFNGDGKIIKKGTSNVSLAGINSSFRGDIHIEEGTLSLIGSANLSNSGWLYINDGTTLNVSQGGNTRAINRIAGAGRIELGNSTIYRIIQLAPGDNGIGVLYVNGPGTLDFSNTKVSIELDPTLSAIPKEGLTHDSVIATSKINVNKTTTIGLYNLQTNASPDEFIHGKRFTVLRAGSGLSSLTEAQIKEDPQSFNPFIEVDTSKTTITDTDVTVEFGIKTVQQATETIARIDTKAVNVASENKQLAAAQYIQKVTGLTGTQAPSEKQLENNSFFQGLTGLDLANMASNNNPEAYASNMSVALEFNSLVANAVFDSGLSKITSRNLTQVINPDTKKRLWLSTLNTNGKVDGDPGKTGNYEYSQSLLLLGLDVFNQSQQTLGFFVGTGNPELKEHDHINQKFNADSWLVGSYFNWQFNSRYRMNTMMFLSQNDFESKRANINTSGQSTSPSESQYKQTLLTLGIQVEDVFKQSDSLLLASIFGFNYTYLDQGAIKESRGGEDYDYEIDSADAQSLVLVAGLDTLIEASIAEKPGYVDFRIRYEFDITANRKETHDLDAGLAGQNKDEFSGQNRGPHALMFGAGYNINLTKSFNLRTDASYTIRSEGHDYCAGLNLAYLF